MNRLFYSRHGSSVAALLDQDIAHIARVMQPSLHGDPGAPILSAQYWRKRLHQLLDGGNLSHAQLYAVDSLLLQLDRFDRAARVPQQDAPRRSAPPVDHSFSTAGTASR